MNILARCACAHQESGASSMTCFVPSARSCRTSSASLSGTPVSDSVRAQVSSSQARENFGSSLTALHRSTLQIELPCLQVLVVSLDIVCAALDPGQGSDIQFDAQRPDHVLCHLFLQHKDIAHLARVALRPGLAAIPAVDQLRSDEQVGPVLADTALKKVGDS